MSSVVKAGHGGKMGNAVYVVRNRKDVKTVPVSTIESQDSYTTPNSIAYPKKSISQSTCTKTYPNQLETYSTPHLSFHGGSARQKTYSLQCRHGVAADERHQVRLVRPCWKLYHRIDRPSNIALGCRGYQHSKPVDRWIPTW